jgi:hypothetical protein
MKQIYFRLLMPLLFFCVQGMFGVLAAQSCALPAPGWLVASEITSSRISIEWEPVSGAQWYQITRFDVTNGVLLPTVYTNETEFDSEPHDPGTTIDFEVRATACNKYDPYGPAATGSYTTTIIVVDVVVMHAPGNPSPVTNISAGDTVSFQLKIPLSTENLEVTHLKILSPDNGKAAVAEVMLWSCGTQLPNQVVKVQYYNQAGWTPGIQVEEVYGGGAPNQIVELRFIFNGSLFFRLVNPTYYINGPYNFGGIQMVFHRPNGRYGTEIYQVSNPCGGSGVKPGAPVKTHLESSTASDRNAPQAAVLSAAPNPFNDHITVQCSLNTETSVRLLMTDMTGRTVKDLQLPILSAGEHTAYIQTNNLPTGIYLLTIQTETGAQTTKLVKH